MAERDHPFSQKERLQQFEQADSLREARVLHEKPLFLLYSLVSLPGSTTLGEFSLQIGSLSEPAHDWWIGVAQLYSADMIETYGKYIRATETGRDFYREWDEIVGRLNGETPASTSSQT